MRFLAHIITFSIFFREKVFRVTPRNEEQVEVLTTLASNMQVRSISEVILIESILPSGVCLSAKFVWLLPKGNCLNGERKQWSSAEN